MEVQLARRHIIRRDCENVNETAGASARRASEGEGPDGPATNPFAAVMVGLRRWGWPCNLPRAKWNPREERHAVSRPRRNHAMAGGRNQVLFDFLSLLPGLLPADGEQLVDLSRMVDIMGSCPAYDVCKGVSRPSAPDGARRGPHPAGPAGSASPTAKEPCRQAARKLSPRTA